MAVYLDHNATTPLDARVLEAMLPYLREHFGNPSSPHRLGRRARTAIDGAREQVAALVNAHPSQVVFTSGGTEANSLALAGTAMAHAGAGVLAIGATEHPSVSAAAERLALQGWRVVRIDVDTNGRVSRAMLAEMLRRQRPVLVSIMYANNETGVIQDVAALTAVAREYGACFHTDAVQAAGKIEVDFAASGAQLMSLSAHKIYGPKGVGALIVDSSVELEPLLAGGGQEKGRRSGTENVAAIVGFGVAAELARTRLAEQGRRLRQLRARLEAGLGALGGIEVFGQAAERLPNTVYFSVPGIDGPTLLLALDRAGYACASGSACGSDSHEPSPVLRAMGVEPALARGALRVSLGAGNTEADVDGFLDALGAQRQQLQRMSRRAG